MVSSSIDRRGRESCQSYKGEEISARNWSRKFAANWIVSFSDVDGLQVELNGRGRDVKSPVLLDVEICWDRFRIDKADPRLVTFEYPPVFQFEF